MLTDLEITIRPDQWTESGSLEDPRSRLLSSIKVNGLSLHIEAFAVSDKPYRCDDPDCAKEHTVQGMDADDDDAPAWGIDDTLSKIMAAHGDSDVGSYCATEIDGREYVIFGTPFA